MKVNTFKNKTYFVYNVKYKNVKFVQINLKIAMNVTVIKENHFAKNAKQVFIKLQQINSVQSAHFKTAYHVLTHQSAINVKKDFQAPNANVKMNMGFLINNNKNVRNVKVHAKLVIYRDFVCNAWIP